MKSENAYNKLIANYRMLGYRLIQLGFGEIVGERPNGTTVFMNKNGHTITNEFEYIKVLGEGVYKVDHDDKVCIINKGHKTIELREDYINRSGTDMQYVYGYYIYSDEEEGSIEVFNTQGKRILRLETSEINHINRNGNELFISTHSVLNFNIGYSVVILNIEDDKYTQYAFKANNVSSLFNSNYSSNYNIMYIGDNKIVISSDKNTCIYNLCSKEIYSLEGFSCNSYIRIVNEDLEQNYLYTNEQIIIKNTENKRYYSMDRNGTMELIDTDMRPLVFYKGYYIAAKDGLQFILDSKFNIISKGYKIVEFISDNIVIGLNMNQLFTLQLDTMEEKKIGANDVDNFSIFLRSNTILVKTSGEKEDYILDTSGEFLSIEREYTKYITM